MRLEQAITDVLHYNQVMYPDNLKMTLGGFNPTLLEILDQLDQNPSRPLNTFCQKLLLRGPSTQAYH